MTLHFEKYAAKGNEFVNKVAVRLGHPEARDRAGRVLRCVLRALRNRLTVEENLQLLAQLPMAIKSVYVEGWKPGQQFERIKTIEEFAEEVIRQDGMSAWRDFSGHTEAIEAIEAVMKTVADYVSAGELHDVIGLLPGEVQKHFMVWVHTP
jgi:uncharacterized protein (DUF2267 family)